MMGFAVNDLICGVYTTCCICADRSILVTSEECLCQMAVTDVVLLCKNAFVNCYIGRSSRSTNYTP